VFHIGGVIHGDIKLANILESLSPTGGREFKVADFGHCGYFEQGLSAFRPDQV
jgi:serine/threonine protein kinase